MITKSTERNTRDILWIRGQPLPLLRQRVLQASTETDMIEPESGKPDNWSTLLGSLATLFGALAAWFYRKSGQAARPENKPDAAMLRRELQPILAQLDELTRSLGSTNQLVEETNEKVVRMEGGVRNLGVRLARMEGHQEHAGD